MKRTHTDYTIADLTARYTHDPGSGCVGLMLFPSRLTDRLVRRRTTLAGEREIDVMPGPEPPAAGEIDPLVHLKLVGDPYPGAFAQGRTMRGAPSNDRFRYRGQATERHGHETTVITTLADDTGIVLEHHARWHAGEPVVEVWTHVMNESPADVTLEMLSSFSLGGITPFDAADAPGRLRVHRFRSVWSAEGRLDTQSIEQLQLERSWSGAGKFSERFGQVGSMPVRGWFPFVAVQDTVAGVTWGAQLAWAGSWQMEVFRQHDELCIGGGLADREFGQWMKRLAPGELITTPSALLSCVAGGLDDLCDRLTSAQNRAADQHPAIERSLPVVFNEWCTTWGDPSQRRIEAIADRVRGRGITYFVIDAGWYKTDTGDWNNGHGDWRPSAKLFPGGIERAAEAVRERGLVPGLWFEMETVGEASTAFSLTDHLLKRDRLPLTVRQRRFWDLTDPFAVDYLAERVIGLLDRCGFGYLKVDYNETIGLGADHPDSQGEGLRQQVLGVYRFFDLIRERLPGLVIENCSSGGHRLEPSMIGRTAMSSFSDAHETREIPIIAANLHRLMLPRQSQVWAVLHPDDPDQRLVYSLAAGFLGRLCLSGGVDRLSDEQWSLVDRATTLYHQAAPIIADGVSRRYGETGESWRHPTGWQAVVRHNAACNQVLAVLHTFSGAPGKVEVPLPAGDWRVDQVFSDGPFACDVGGSQLACDLPHDDAGSVVLLFRRPPASPGPR